MSSNSLKNAWAKFVDFFLGPKCESGRPHRKGEHKYCQHPDCVAERDEASRVDKVTLLRDNAALAKYAEAMKQYNLEAYGKGIDKGRQMERKKLYNTLLESRKHLLASLATVGIAEPRVRQFIDWYETKRDARVNPRSDDVTYHICKNIVELEEVLTQVASEAQITE